ncbi:MAG: PAS domain-containing sensor histidine kinase [Acidobacteriota bacterium]
MTSHWCHADRQSLFDEIPCSVVVIDREFIIVDHNPAFADMFGAGVGRYCYSHTRGRQSPCQNCPAESTFQDGQRRVLEQNGRDCNGRQAHLLVQVTPIHDSGGGVEHIAVMSTDLTSTKRLQREYQTLFEQVPCFVAVLNREFRVVKANRMFRLVFGEPTGEHCYTLLKRRQQKCPDCPAERTFADGGTHTSRHIGVSRTGADTHYMVSTAPLLAGEESPNHVIEMALDLSDVHMLQQELDQASRLRETLVEASLDAIVVLDSRGRVRLFNQAAERLTQLSRDDVIGEKLPRGLLPTQVRPLLAGEVDHCLLHATTLTTAGGDTLPVRLAGVVLRDLEKPVGAALVIQDLRDITRLEREKLEAERLAAVGQTVAGLAHGIKNILTGLEGGMYVTSTGLQRGDSGRTKQGWEMLERNIGRISMLVKNLLAFSRGEGPKLALIDPGEVVRDVYELYRESAGQHGVHLQLGVQRSTERVVMDREGLHTCLANLVSNALDACLVSGVTPCDISLRLDERDNTVIFEVADSGCGMDYDVKQKVFTSFFSTKGAGGTGLGLLLTRKIVQQHGGTITFESTPGQGTVFRLSFPRDRLPRLPDHDHDGGAADQGRPSGRES